MKITCPFCLNSINDSPTEEIVCPSCGSTFRLDNLSTAGWLDPEGQRMIGRFELIDFLGRGAFGTVYMARDPELDRVVAIKVPRSESIVGETEWKRFMREGRNAAQLRHPSIVSVHEVGRADNTPYLVCDFVRGVTLADLLSSQQLSHRETAETVAAVAEALDYAHQRGVVHRDVKPSNIMLDDDRRVYVMDFGLAKRDGGDVTVTMDGQVLGTPAYMSPEQAAGELHQVDGRSDVYSLGVVMYHLLTGELPFRGNMRMLLYQVRNEEPRAPRRLNDRIPRDMETMCLKAMAKEPHRRYPCAGEFAADLRRFLAGQPIQARPVGRAERFWRWCRRKPMTAGLTAAVLLLLLVTAVGGIWAAVYFAQARDRIAKAQTEATTARDDALREAEKANSLAKKEKKLRARFETIADKNAAQLGQFFVARGTSRIKNADPGAALLWFSRALQADDLDSIRRRLHRIRLITHLGTHRRPLHVFSPHEGGRLVSLLTGDGPFYRYFSKPDDQRIWDRVTGKPFGAPLDYSGEFNAMVVSAGRRRIVTNRRFPIEGKKGHYRVGDYRLWDAETGKQLARSDFAQLSGNGKSVAALKKQGDSYFFELWNAETARPIAPAVELGQSTHRPSLSFSNDDGHVVAVCRELTGEKEVRQGIQRDAVRKTTVHVFETETGKELGEPTVFSGAMEPARVQFTRVGRFFAAIERAKRRLWVWNLETGAAHALPQADVVAFHLCPNSSRILVRCEAAGDQPDEWYVWDAATASRLAGPAAVGERVEYVVFSNDGRRLLLANREAVSVRDAVTLDEVLELRSDKLGSTKATMQFTAPRLNHDGRRLLLVMRGAGADADWQTQVWDVDSKRPLASRVPIRRGLAPYGNWPGPVAVFPNGRRFVTMHNGYLRIWDFQSFKPTGVRLDLFRDGEHTIFFGPDGRFAEIIRGSRTELGGVYSRTLWDLAPPQPDNENLLRVVSNLPKQAAQPFCKQGDRVLLATRPVTRRTPGRGSFRSQVLVIDASATKKVGAKYMVKRIGPPVGYSGQRISQALLSPDGKSLVTLVTSQAGSDGVGPGARLWHSRSGKPLAELAPDVPITDILASGQRLVLRRQDGFASLWDLSKRVPTTLLLNLHGPIDRVWFGDDPRGPIFTAGDDGRLQLWVPRGALTRSILGAIPYPHIGTPPFRLPSPVTHADVVTTGKRDGTFRFIAVAACRNGNVYLVDPNTGKEVAKPLRHTGAIDALCVLNRNLAKRDFGGALVCTVHSTFRIWDSASAKVIKIIEHEDDVVHMQLARAGPLVTTVTREGVIQRWNLATGKSIGTALRHSGPIRTVVQKDNRVCTVAEDGSFMISDLQNGKPLFPKARKVPGKLLQVQIVSGKVWGLIAGAKGLEIRDLLADRTYRRLAASENSKTACFSHPYVCAIDTDNVIRLWRSGSRPLEIRHRVVAAKYSPDGRRLVTAADDGTVRVWNARTGTPITKPLQHFDPEIYQSQLKKTPPKNRPMVLAGMRFTPARVSNSAAVCFTPDSRRILSIGPLTVRVWDAEEGTSLAALAHENVDTVAFDRRGSLLATASRAGIRLWNMQAKGTFKETAFLKGRADVHLSFSPDGRYLRAAGPWRATVFNVASGEPFGGVQYLEEPQVVGAFGGSAKQVRRARFTHDSRRIVTVLRQEALFGKKKKSNTRVWDVESGRPLTPSLQHNGPVDVAEFSHDGHMLVTVCRIQTRRGANTIEHGSEVCVWHAATGQTISPVRRFDATVTYTAFSEDDNHIVLRVGDRLVAWSLVDSDDRSPDEHRELAELVAARRLDDTGNLIPLTTREYIERLEASLER